MTKVCWLSAGVSSAVAMLLNKPDLAIYIDIEDQHPDSLRFCKDVCNYTNTPLEVLTSPYRSVETVCRKFRYVNGPAGARCTQVLKKDVRKAWESVTPGPFTYIWGFDSIEKKRAERLFDAMPEVDHSFPLIEKELTKQDAHAFLSRKGINRPTMYDLGYQNNNCIGCVKGGMGYWNKIRQDFPNVFHSRAAMERDIKRSCINKVFLDELDPLAGRDQKPISQDCGVMCLLSLEETE